MKGGDSNISLKPVGYRVDVERGKIKKKEDEAYD